MKEKKTFQELQQQSAHLLKDPHIEDNISLLPITGVQNLENLTGILGKNLRWSELE